MSEVQPPGSLNVTFACIVDMSERVRIKLDTNLTGMIYAPVASGRFYRVLAHLK